MVFTKERVSEKDKQWLIGLGLMQRFDLINSQMTSGEIRDWFVSSDGDCQVVFTGGSGMDESMLNFAAVIVGGVINYVSFLEDANGNWNANIDAEKKWTLISFIKNENNFKADAEIVSQFKSALIERFTLSPLRKDFESVDVKLTFQRFDI